MARRSKEEAQETYQALLKAAADLFMEKGVAPTTLQEIAERAGLTRGAVYWHFDGKEDIITALLSTYALPYIDQFETEIAQLPRSSDAGRQFRICIDRLMDNLINDERAGQTMSISLHMAEFTSAETDFQAFLKDMHLSRYRALTETFSLLSDSSCLRGELPPELYASGLFSYFLGLIHEHFSPHPVIDLRQSGRSLLGLYLDAILHIK